MYLKFTALIYEIRLLSSWNPLLPHECGPARTAFIRSSNKDVCSEATDRVDALRPWNAFSRFLLVDVPPTARDV